MVDNDKAKIEKLIIETLKQNQYGLTISELSRLIKINRVTLSKYLDVLREKGLIDYRSVGRAKIWYISEDISIMEAIFGDRDLNKLLRKNDDGFYAIGDINFFILPSEVIQDLYLLLGKKYDFNIIRQIGRRMGEHLANTYKIYSGYGRIYNRDIIENIIRFIEKMGFGKIDEVDIDLKSVYIIVRFTSLLEAEELSNIIDEFPAKKKDGLKCYFTEGLLEGLISILLGYDVISSEVKSKLKGDKYNEYVIKKVEE